MLHDNLINDQIENFHGSSVRSTSLDHHNSLKNSNHISSHANVNNMHRNVHFKKGNPHYISHIYNNHRPINNYAYRHYNIGNYNNNGFWHYPYDNLLLENSLVVSKPIVYNLPNQNYIYELNNINQLNIIDGLNNIDELNIDDSDILIAYKEPFTISGYSILETVTTIVIVIILLLIISSSLNSKLTNFNILYLFN